jgi:uncharacterized protein YcgL (UPF0745 family)
MQCFIYKSLRKAELYIYLDKRNDFSAVPEVLLQNFGRLAFVMEMELTPDRKLAREDTVKVIASIQAKGFFVQMPPLVISLPLAETNRQLH